MHKIETLYGKMTAQLSAQDFKRQVIWKKRLVMTDDRTLFPYLVDIQSFDVLGIIYDMIT